MTSPNDAGPSAHLDYYRGVLHELIGLGVELARAVQRGALAQAEIPGADCAEAVATYDRAARVVRRCVLLAHSLDRPLAAPVARGAVDPVGARRRVLRAVEDAIQREHPDGGERLEAELLERLDAPEFATDLLDRTVDEVIADICRDLGLAAAPGTRPWKRRRPADVAMLHARAAGGADTVATPGLADGVSGLLRPARFRGK